MRPKWDKVTDLAKANKVCCTCFRINMQAQGCMPLAHAVLIIGDSLEGTQRIIATYAEKNKIWEDTKTKGPTRLFVVQISSPSRPCQRPSPGH